MHTESSDYCIFYTIILLFKHMGMAIDLLCSGNSFTWYMRRIGIYSFKIPNSFCCTREMVSQKTSSIFSVKCCCETPFISRKRTQVANFNHQEITWHGWNSFLVQNSNWSTEIMNLEESPIDDSQNHPIT